MFYIFTAHCFVHGRGSLLGLRTLAIRPHILSNPRRRHQLGAGATVNEQICQEKPEPTPKPEESLENDVNEVEEMLVFASAQIPNTNFFQSQSL